MTEYVETYMTKRTPNQKIDMLIKEVAEWRNLYNDLRIEILTIRDEVEEWANNDPDAERILRLIANDLTRAVEA
jgi:hypothetical protein